MSRVDVAPLVLRLAAVMLERELEPLLGPVRAGAELDRGDLFQPDPARVRMREARQDHRVDEARRGRGRSARRL